MKYLFRFLSFLFVVVLLILPIAVPVAMAASSGSTLNVTPTSTVTIAPGRTPGLIRRGCVSHYTACNSNADNPANDSISDPHYSENDRIQNPDYSPDNGICDTNEYHERHHLQPRLYLQRHRPLRQFPRQRQPRPSCNNISSTQTTAIPVVTVTVFVYPSGSVYRPSYYYPPGYPYDSSSYYPVGYPYDQNSYYSTGTLTVTSNPSGATVLLDEFNSEITPWVFTGLATGYHTVEINYPGYDDYLTDVYIDSGASAEVNADLNVLDSFGSLFIDSTPRGAGVYVDGDYQGTSPVTVGAMSVGAHQVELHLAGYEVLTSTQYVAAGQGTIANLVMVPYTSSSVEGSIDITSNLPGELVYLDGTYKGSTQSGTTFDVISVSPGSHTVLLHLPGTRILPGRSR